MSFFPASRAAYPRPWFSISNGRSRPRRVTRTGTANWGPRRFQTGDTTMGWAMSDQVETKNTDAWDEVQYDHRESRLSAAPYDLWRRLRSERPVIHSDRYGGFWYVSRYDDVKKVLRDWKTFTSTEGIG